MMEQGAVVYTYLFKERSSTNVWPKWMGVMHGYEIEYFFGVPVRKPADYTQQEIEFSRRMMHYWVSFAKHGEPRLLSRASQRGIRSSPSEHARHHNHVTVPHWPIYGPAKRYLILQSAPLKPGESWIEQRVDGDDCGFWRETKRVCQSRDSGSSFGSSVGSSDTPKTNTGVRQLTTTNRSYLIQICVIGLIWCTYLRTRHI